MGTQKKKEKTTTTFQAYSDLLLLGLMGIPVGIIVGAIDTVFGVTLIKITQMRDEHPFTFIPFLALAGLFIVFYYKKWGKDSSKGMGLVFEVGHGTADTIPLRLIPFVMVGTWLTHLFGGSAGREGVAVQLGATVSHNIGKQLPFKHTKNHKKIFLITGMAAGFAGLFQTPIAAIAFALELLAVGVIEYPALFPAFTAAFSASFTSHFLGLEKFSFMLSNAVPKGFMNTVGITNIGLNLETILKVMVLGAIFGVVGGEFAAGLQWLKKKFADCFKNPYVRIGVVAIGLSIIFLLLHQGRYSGLGTNLISASFDGSTIYSYDWILKFALTIITLAAGFQGGEVTPLFSIGASLGIVLAGIFHLPLVFVAALGYACVFGGATNTHWAPMFIGAEVFGYAFIPYFFIACTFAYLCNGNQSIYSLQKR